MSSRNPFGRSDSKLHGLLERHQPAQRDSIRHGCSFLSTGVGHQELFECKSCELEYTAKQLLDYKKHINKDVPDYLADERFGSGICGHCINTCHKGHAVSKIFGKWHMDEDETYLEGYCRCGEYGCVHNPRIDDTNLPLNFHEQRQSFVYNSPFPLRYPAPMELPKDISEADAQNYRAASKLFRTHDKNHDGEFNRREFKKCMEFAGHEIPREVVVLSASSRDLRKKKGGGWKQLFDVIDKDTSGRIEEREFCEYYVFSKKAGLIREKPKVLEAVSATPFVLPSDTSNVKFLGTYTKGKGKRKHELRCTFSFLEGKILGGGNDKSGEFTWEGTVSATSGEVVLSKKYKDKTGVYKGRFRDTEFAGTWELAGDSGTFQLSCAEQVAEAKNLDSQTREDKMKECQDLITQIAENPFAKMEDLQEVEDLLSGLILKIKEREKKKAESAAENFEVYVQSEWEGTWHVRPHFKNRKEEEAFQPVHEPLHLKMVFADGQIASYTQEAGLEYRWSGKYSASTGSFSVIKICKNKDILPLRFDGVITGDTMRGGASRRFEAFREFSLKCTSGDIKRLGIGTKVVLQQPRLKDSSVLEKMVDNWVKHEKTKLVLSLDGGGIRGCLTIGFLCQLEKALKKPLPQVFDLIAGTSTGAIQAGLIAGLGLSAAQANEKTTEENFKAIFPYSRIKVGLTMPKYNGDGKTKVMKKYFGDIRLKDTKVPILIPTYYLNNHEAKIFNDLDHPEEKLASAIDCSSAAPTYFPAIEQDEQVDPGYYIDGGVSANDPSILAYIDAKQRWPDCEIRVLSIGTGVAEYHVSSKTPSYGAYDWMAKGNLIDIMLDTSLACIQAKALLGNNYVRSNAYLKPAGCAAEMDNRTPGNIKNLKKLGRLLYKSDAVRVLDLLTKPYSANPVALGTERLGACNHQATTTFDLGSDDED